MLVLLLVTVITLGVFFLLKLNYSYWARRGVPGPKPLPVVGNLGKSFLFLEPLGIRYSKIYNQYQNEEMVGIYRSTTPAVLARDPEFIKEIVTKSFSHFHDNDIYLDKKTDPILGRNPFMLKGEEWKTVRAQLTPGFTSGKMKWLYPLLEEVCGNLVKFIDKHPETTNGEGYEAKELCVRFTLNNVATCAFGVEGKCLEQENSDFRKLSEEFFAPDGWFAFSFIFASLFPSISKVLPVRMTTKKVEDKLLRLVSATLKYREENNVRRNDFLDIMSQLRRTSTGYVFTDVDVTAHAAGFFGDGSETSSLVMCFTLYEIAANPKTQEKLREEVDKAFEENDNKLPYEALQVMKYLDAVIDETLRLHPPVFSLQKTCTEDFTYKLKSGNMVTIEKGTPIILPVFGLHRDAKFFPEPEKFQPERFLDINNINKYAYLPFGEGPRACLGKRFGLLQIKVGIAHIIRNFELSVNKKTIQPIKYMNTAFVRAEGGLWLCFKKIAL